MTRSINEPSVKLFDESFDKPEREEFSGLRGYFEQGGSIFPVVEQGIKHLMDQYALPADKAQRFLQRANALAAYVARQFIEQSLTRREIKERALVPGAPTFEEISEIDFSALCPQDALESVDSVVAYLVALFQWLAKVEAYGDTTMMMPLKDRRPDLEKLWIDFASTHGRLSSVEMGTRVLESFIQEHAQSDDTPVDIDEELKLACYPFLLPFYRSWEALNAIARFHEMSVGDLVRRSDPSGPAFLSKDAKTAYSDRALRLSSTLGPYRQALLTAPPVFPEFTEPKDATPDISTPEAEAFYEKFFGADGIQAQTLNEKKEFGRRSEQRTEDIESILSYKHFAPIRSPNVSSVFIEDENPVGSFYVNGGYSPALDIHEEGARHLIRHIPNWREERLSRFIRLKGWMQTTAAETDALFMAVNRIETSQEGEHKCWMNTNTMRALGQFHTFRQRFDCRAEEYVAWLGQLSIDGRGDQLSQFDRVFNAETFFPAPLKIDDKPFPVIPDPAKPEQMLTINLLCNGLRINLETYLYLAVVIAEALGLGNQLSRSLNVYSAFFRLVTLSRQLGISPQETCSLLVVLGDGKATWLKALAGNPCINPSDDTQIDALRAIDALTECVGWWRAHQLNPSWVIKQLIAQPAPTVVSEAAAALFAQMRIQVTSVLLTETTLQEAGVTPLSGGREWLVLLTALVNERGIVISQSDERETNYAAFARPLIEDAVNQAIGELNAVLVETILNVLLICREGQIKVVREGLVTYAGIASPFALSVLAWAGGQVSQLLVQALKRSTSSEGELAGAPQAEEPGDPFLALLADVLRRAEVVNELAIPERVLSEYLNYGYQKWLALESKAEFSLRVLYYLTVFIPLLEVAQQPLEVLLDYLRRVNALPQLTSADGKRLASEMAANQLAALLGWSARDVHACASHLNEQALIRTLPELDVLLAIHKTATQMGLDARTIIDIGKLPAELKPDEDDTGYRLVAERALESVSQQSIATDTTALEAFATDFKFECKVDKTLLVANKVDDVATFTLTLTNTAGTPLKEVGIHCLARLGCFEKERVQTNAQGIAIARLYSFASDRRIDQGVETPQFTVDMDEPRLADSVVVDSEVSSLRFDPEMKSPVPETLELNQEIELYVALYNAHPLNNPGIGKQVVWSSDQGTIRPSTTLTDKNGVSRVVFTRTKPGVCTISAEHLLSSATTEFEFPALTTSR
ncbi:Tc toxin subunit A [Pseudomonas sp. KCJK9016]|uniref:Tc toxin subunit A n=1 Tax=Pseudomonas sp. KCJK9016 TaxID=3344556 RepID=UPI0039057A95